eukprot:scaffold30678_cov108-Isochrysis_galbana.AAC.1
MSAHLLGALCHRVGLVQHHDLMPAGGQRHLLLRKALDPAQRTGRRLSRGQNWRAAAASLPASARHRCRPRTCVRVELAPPGGGCE